ncbi:hypothetical protein [Mesorhizobium sp.]|uniref:hypothetical protein n=1 Tax=Mesorhizobium sp. TaxID=1871066 RepID=UPI003BA92E32
MTVDLNDPMAVAKASAEAMWKNDRASQNLGMALDHVALGICYRSWTSIAVSASTPGDRRWPWVFSAPSPGRTP